MNSVGYSETEQSDWQKLHGVLTLQLETYVWMKSKSRLIKRIVNLEILLDEIKKTVNTKKDKLRIKKKVLRCDSSFLKLNL